MSPLIDVTNIVIQDITQSNNESSSDIRSTVYLEVKNDSCSISVPKNSHESRSDKVGAPNTKSTTVRLKCLKRRKQQKLSKLRENDVPTVLPKDDPPVNDRVPPIGGEDQFVQNFENLLISDKSTKRTYDSTEKPKLPQEKLSTVRCDCVTGSSNNVGPPSGGFTSTYQCIACGLELSSIENLTNHLVKHVYEGLHAASWLNNAMSLLLSRNSTSQLEINSSPQSAQASCTSKETLPSSIGRNDDNSELSSTVSSPQT